MATNSTGCTEWERDFDPATEQPYPSRSEWADFLKSHQEQVANLLAEIERLNAELAKAAKTTGRPVGIAADSEGQGGGRWKPGTYSLSSPHYRSEQ